MPDRQGAAAYMSEYRWIRDKYTKLAKEIGDEHDRVKESTRK